MSKSFKVDLTGQRFGRLTVLEFVPTEDRFTYWLCRCECGNTATVRAGHLKEERTTSCGCLREERIVRLNRTHGNANTRLYKIYHGIKKRCLNPNTRNYNNYGARGITICDEWLNDFVAFRDWALANGYNDTFSIDRIDVNGNYEPSNCRWTDRKTQCRNRQRNVFVEYQGEMIPLAEAAERTGIDYKVLHFRYQHGDRGKRLFRPVK